MGRAGGSDSHSVSFVQRRLFLSHRRGIFGSVCKSFLPVHVIGSV